MNQKVLISIDNILRTNLFEKFVECYELHVEFFRSLKLKKDDENIKEFNKLKKFYKKITNEKILELANRKKDFIDSETRNFILELFLDEHDYRNFLENNSQKLFSISTVSGEVDKSMLITLKVAADQICDLYLYDVSDFPLDKNHIKMKYIFDGISKLKQLKMIKGVLLFHSKKEFDNFLEDNFFYDQIFIAENILKENNLTSLVPTNEDFKTGIIEVQDYELEEIKANNILLGYFLEIEEKNQNNQLENE